jgi:hypothetical protein
VHCGFVSVQDGHGFVGVGVGAAVGVAVGGAAGVGRDVGLGVTGGRLDAAVGVAFCPGDSDAFGAGDTVL